MHVKRSVIITVVYIAAISSLLVTSSCSCLRRFSGIVYSASSGKPISGAKISVLNKKHKQNFFTDSAGYAEISLHGGCKCPRIKTVVQVQGYQRAYVKEPKTADTVMIYLDGLKDQQ